MRITEIYQSIQGESSYAGLPCVFVRTTGCDLRCSWCDSEFTFSGGTQMTLDQITGEVEKYDCKLVELTGGEPLLQPEIYELATRLANAGHTLLIETGGHRDISKLDPRVIRIMDLKCPASGECEKNLFSSWPSNPSRTVRFLISTGPSLRTVMVCAGRREGASTSATNATATLTCKRAPPGIPTTAAASPAPR